ncbi:alpha/beta fold hydrolase [Kitasatospora sp. NPDC050543]|uniref:alpha/beta fold hydrolase n=1 Tax=Kitasatospora sp. NPDC050543 TaxID=3364054 RepID=UPI003788EEB6
MADHQIIELGAVRLAYRSYGDPAAPPLVLLHALGESGADWAEVAPALARHRRVLAPDLRGHGRSDWPGAYSLELMRDDVLAFLDALGLAGVELVGHSMGGVVAYLLAQAQPERVVRLVLEDVPPPFPRERSVTGEPAEPVAFDWAVVAALKAQLDEPDPSWRARLGGITAPTLMVAGGPASHVPQDRIAEMARRIPDCRSVTIPAGHLVHAARPAEFIRAVEHFLLVETPTPPHAPHAPDTR